MKQTENQPPNQAPPQVIVIMGVAGAGKSTVGKLLSERIGYQFFDADDFHSAANRQKMSGGIPLTDEDRGPWLEAMREAIERWLAGAQSVVLACSALKHSYRELLAVSPAVAFIYLKAPRSLVAARLNARTDHYMKTDMVESQFAALEEPDAKEAFIVDASQPCEDVVQTVCQRLGI